MKILFTGASSFTGYWFVKTLVAAGHEVVATIRQKPETYADEVRRQRTEKVLALAKPIWGASFGDDAFVDALKGGFDVLCHHGADVRNYRSPDFDTAQAFATNTHNLPKVLDALKAGGGSKVLLTGSVFENDEGAGSEGLGAFSPYGLSKALTYQSFRFYAATKGVTLGKFVIPNPFGPYEEARFTQYLVKTWFDGKVAGVKTPAYVRDNIHVSLLASAYAKFAASLPAGGGLVRLGPSGYVESQGAFARRFAAEMEKRLGVACGLDLSVQTEFTEPRVRINTDLVVDPTWSESAAWDDLAAYYKQVFKR
ncbi:NAD(P)-dependent oxidoreductase [Myxococcota bacterium]|nr:NAD(P)-dependent oxidoreductase [Myxococcota bacterium]